MASSKTTTKTIRIANEAAEYFKEKPLNRAVESLYEHLTDGTLSFDGEQIKVECTHQNTEKSSLGTPENTKKVSTLTKTDYESIAEMANLMQVSTEKLFSDIRELLENGELYYSGGKLTNPRYEEFERACGNRDIDKILESMIRSL